MNKHCRLDETDEHPSDRRTDKRNRPQRTHGGHIDRPYHPARRWGTVSDSTFGQMLTNSIDNLQGLQEKSQGLAVQAVTGDLDDIHDYTIASTEAKVTLELTAAIRNKAVDAFNEIMRMQA